MLWYVATGVLQRFVQRFATLRAVAFCTSPLLLQSLNEKP